MLFATAALRIGTRDVNNLLERHESKNVIGSEVSNLAVKILRHIPSRIMSASCPQFSFGATRYAYGCFSAKLPRYMKIIRPKV